MCIAMNNINKNTLTDCQTSFVSTLTCTCILQVSLLPPTIRKKQHFNYCKPYCEHGI